MPSWFKHLPVVSRAKLMQTFARARDRNAPLPRMRGARIIDMEAWKHPRVGRKVWYIDRFEVFYVTRDIERMFDIDKATVYKWIKLGLIPEPVVTRPNHYKKLTRYWIRPQLRAAALVINDLRRQGALRFTKTRVAGHIKMLKEGNRQAVDNWHESRDRDVAKKARKIVRWID